MMMKSDAVDRATKAAANRLKDSRLKAGFATAAEAARKMGANPVTYTAHENGGRDFSREQCLAYAKALKVDPGWLMFGDIALRPGNIGIGSGRIPEIDQATQCFNNKPPVASVQKGYNLAAFRAYADRWWEIPADTLRETFRVSAQSCFVMEVSEADSRGNVRPGDRVLIDTDQDFPNPSGLFLIDMGRAISLRHAYFDFAGDSQKIMLEPIAANTAAASLDINSGPKIILGRVVGFITRAS